jgi:hypothetical protein
MEGVIQNLHAGHIVVYIIIISNNPFICGKHRSSYVLDYISLSLDSRNKLVLDNFPLTELVSWPETFMCLVTHTTHTINCSHPKE